MTRPAVDSTEMLAKINSIHQEVGELKKEVHEVRKDVHETRKEVHEARKDIKKLTKLFAEKCLDSEKHYKCIDASAKPAPAENEEELRALLTQENMVCYP